MKCLDALLKSIAFATVKAVLMGLLKTKEFFFDICCVEPKFTQEEVPTINKKVNSFADQY